MFYTAISSLTVYYSNNLYNGYSFLVLALCKFRKHLFCLGKVSNEYFKTFLRFWKTKSVTRSVLSSLNINPINGTWELDIVTSNGKQKMLFGPWLE